MAATQRTRNQPDNANGKLAEVDPLTAAIAAELATAQDAAAIRGDAAELTPQLFMRLLPLLRRPIPEGFIKTTPAVKGKPYESTGVKSVQVFTDRMDAVLTPLWWWHEVTYQNGGKLAHVVVHVGPSRDVPPLVSRESMGGVNQASTDGNLYKSSYTNAAKRAFAALGIAWEVYVGATDLDPDVSEEAAQAQAEGGKAPAQEAKLDPERVEKLAAAVNAVEGLAEHLEMKLRGFGVKRIEDLTYEQGLSLYQWAHDAATGEGNQDG